MSGAEDAVWGEVASVIDVCARERVLAGRRGAIDGRGCRPCTAGGWVKEGDGGEERRAKARRQEIV